MSNGGASDTDVTTVVDLLRHGEPQGGRRFRGQTDDPLSDLGWRQMREAVGNENSWQHIVSSPLQRCSAFAEDLAERHGLPCTRDPGFKEIRFGVWEGFTAEEIQRQHGEEYRRYRKDPETFMPPGAESMAEFVARVANTWESLLDTQRGRRVLLVCHAGVIRAVLSTVLGIAPKNLFRIQIDYASLTRFKVGNDGVPSLIFHRGGLP